MICKGYSLIMSDITLSCKRIYVSIRDTDLNVVNSTTKFLFFRITNFSDDYFVLHYIDRYWNGRLLDQIFILYFQEKTEYKKP